MAKPSLSPKLALELAQRQRHAVITLAIQRAKKAVQAQLQAQGHKVAHFSAKEITVMAEQFLAEHRHEFVAWVIPVVQAWTREGMFGKRAQRAWAETESVRKDAGLRTLAQQQTAQLEENRT
jgi:hypothetical protein